MHVQVRKKNSGSLPDNSLNTGFGLPPELSAAIASSERNKLSGLPPILDSKFIEKVRQSERVFVVSHLGYFLSNFGNADIRGINSQVVADRFMDERWSKLSLTNPKQYLYEQKFRAFFDTVKDSPVLITVPFDYDSRPIPGKFWNFVINYIASRPIQNDNLRILPTEPTTGALNSLPTRAGDYQTCLTRQLAEALRDKQVYAAGGAVNYCLRFSLLDLKINSPRLIQGLLDYNPVWGPEDSAVRLRRAEKWVGNPYDPALDIFLRVRSPKLVSAEIDSLKRQLSGLRLVKPVELLELN